MPVPPSALHRFLWDRQLSRENFFSSVELAIALDISALECRDALQAFVDMELMSYAGLDQHGVERWTLSKTGFAVWQSARVLGRATKDRIQEFHQCLPHVATALSQYPSVVSVRVAGASLTGAAYGLFYIGIEVDPADTSPLAELRLIDTAVQMSCGAEQLENGLKPDTPCVMVFDARTGTPHRLRTGKVIYERRSRDGVIGIEKAAYYCSDKVDALEASWHSRLNSYEELLRTGDRDRHVSEAFLAYLHGKVIQPPKRTQAFEECRFAVGMVNIERERMERPACCAGTDQQWPGEGLSTPPPDNTLLRECRQMFDFLGTPLGWQIAAAKADYAYSCGRPKILQSKAVLTDCLRYGYRHDPYCEWMSSKPAARVLQALAIVAGEFRAELKDRDKEAPPLKKEPGKHHFISLVDIARPQPTCVGIVRLTAKSIANYHAAVRQYGFHIPHITPGVRVLYEEGYLTAEPFLANRPATPEEIKKFEQIASASKKAVSYVLEDMGETLVGHKGFATSRSSFDLKLRLCDPGLPLPIDMSPYDEDVILQALSKMPADLVVRLSEWWIFPASVPIADVAKACMEAPESSLLARFANPQGSFVFTRMRGTKARYRARIDGTDWFLEFTDLGSKRPPFVHYGYRGHTSSAQMEFRYRPWNGVLSELLDVMRALTVLKQLGVEPSLVDIQKGEHSSSSGPLAEFESLLNALFAGRHFHESFQSFDSWFENCFGAAGAGREPKA